MARPKIKIDADTVKKLAAINCSYDEIGSVVGCSPDTLERRFAGIIKEGRDQGRMSLKRKMWDHAMGGNTTMMIWLSKQMLGYADKLDQSLSTGERGFRITVEDYVSDPSSDPASAKAKVLP